MNAHTPGPWTWSMDKIGRGPVGKGNTVHAALGASRPNCPPPYRTGVLTPNWCTDVDGQVWNTWISVKEADARLIAAAPDLLEALRVLLCDVEAVDAVANYGLELQVGMYQAHKAILKATTGETK